MTTTTPPPTQSSLALESKRTASNGENATPAAVAAAAAAEAALPSTEDSQADECVLCAYPLPLKEGGSVYQSCCGKVICYGCLIGQLRVLVLGTNVEKPIQGSKEEEEEFMTMLLSEQFMVCPFCRAPEPTDDKELVKELWNRIDEYKDPEAMNMLGRSYEKGDCGLSKKPKKAKELYQRSYDLGNLNAAHHLTSLYTEYIPDADRMLQYAEEGARRGHTACMNAVGVHHIDIGNNEEAPRHFMMAARSGDKEALQNLTECYRHELVSKDDLATILRAHQAAHDKETSEPREYARRYNNLREKEQAVIDAEEEEEDDNNDEKEQKQQTVDGEKEEGDDDDDDDGKVNTEEEEEDHFAYINNNNT